MPNQISPSPASGRRTVLYAAGVGFTVVLFAGATILGRSLFAGEPVTPRATLDANAPATPTPAATSRVSSTRLVVQGPRRLLDPQVGGDLGPGATATVPLPTLPAGTTAVALQVSLRDAKGPGAVTMRSSTEHVHALRIAAAHAQTTAIVVVGIGPDRALRVRTDGGGRLQIDLVGAFEPAATSTSGRIVVTRVTRLLRLTPARDGHDAVIDLSQVPALQEAGAVSAVLIQVSGDVGAHGGYVAFGPSRSRLDQSVFWSATQGQDRIRPGFVLVPLRSDTLHLQYHAGTQMRADLVGYVTGPAAPEDSAGLAVPVPAADASPVKVTVDGPVDVTLVPAAGTAGFTPDRVSAVLMTVNATADVPAAVSVDPPDSGAGRVPDVSAANTGRSALTLSRVVDGAATVASAAPATVVLTPRVLVLGR